VLHNATNISVDTAIKLEFDKLQAATILSVSGESGGNEEEPVNQCEANIC
jgi:hypothetical protein